MNLQEIQSAVEAGKTVYCNNKSYTVIKDTKNQWLIKHVGGHCIGLTWADGTTMNEKEESFFMEDEAKKTGIPNLSSIGQMTVVHNEEPYSRYLETSEFIYFVRDLDSDHTLMYRKETLDIVSDNWFAENDLQGRLARKDYTWASEAAMDTIYAMEKIWSTEDSESIETRKHHDNCPAVDGGGCRCDEMDILSPEEQIIKDIAAVTEIIELEVLLQGKGITFYEIDNMVPVKIINEQNIEFDGTVPVTHMLVVQTNGWWILRHADGNYYTMAYRDEKYGTLEECIRLIQYAGDYENLTDKEHQLLLSKVFSKVLHQWFTPEQMVECIKKNRELYMDSGICASHDYYDTNMAMAEAYQLLFNREVDTQDDGDRNLWNHAWDLAKNADFYHLSEPVTPIEDKGAKYACIWTREMYEPNVAMHDLSFFTDANGYEAQEIDTISKLPFEKLHEVSRGHYVMCIDAKED